MPPACPWMLLFLTLWALVPCLVLVTLYFFSSAGGKSGGNKKNDGVKVSPPEPGRAGVWQRFRQQGPPFRVGARPRPC